MPKKVPYLFDPKLVKAAVFGANDGIVTTFAVVAGAAGADLSTKVILILGISNLVADGVSMGMGDFLGERSEQKLLQQEKLRFKKNRLWVSGLVTFVFFLIAGSLPLVPYVAQAIFGLEIPLSKLELSVIATAISLFIIGSARSLVIKGSWLRNGLEMLVVGAVSSGAAYLIGVVIERALTM